MKKSWSKLCPKPIRHPNIARWGWGVVGASLLSILQCPALTLDTQQILVKGKNMSQWATYLPTQNTKHGHQRPWVQKFISLRGFLGQTVLTKFWKDVLKQNAHCYSLQWRKPLPAKILTDYCNYWNRRFASRERGKHRNVCGFSKQSPNLYYPIGFSSRSLRVVLENWLSQKPSPWWRLQIMMETGKLGLMVCSHLYTA